VKDKKTIIPLAPIPCPLSLPLTCGTHVSNSSSTFPLRILPPRCARGGLCCPSAAPQPRPPSREPQRVPCPPPGPCRRRRRAGRHARRALRRARCVLRHRPHPPPHPYPGHRQAGCRAVHRCAGRALRRSMPRPPSCWPPSRAPCPLPHRQVPARGAGSSLPRPPMLPLRLRASHACCPTAAGRGHVRARVGARTWWPARRGHDRGTRGGRSTEVQHWADGG